MNENFKNTRQARTLGIVFLVTMIVLAGVVGRAIPPAADGEPYEKQ